MCHDPGACDEAIAYWDALYAADERERQAQREREERRDMMRDEQLAAIKERAPYAAYESGYQAPRELSRSNAYHDIQNLLAEVERLRAREAALVAKHEQAMAIVRDVAAIEQRQYRYDRTTPYDLMISALTITKARALLASE